MVWHKRRWGPLFVLAPGASHWIGNEAGASSRGNDEYRKDKKIMRKERGDAGRQLVGANRVGDLNSFEPPFLLSII